MDRFVCIHGHFYQPPRENAWLEAVELQDSAYPFHDWNERITDECYAPNGASRILADGRRILKIVNNYASISFNFGPTLLAWLEEEAPVAYERILEADRDSIERFSGHGSAMAQGYNHLIFPLANSRDKRTQVVWGIHDFQHRFERAPEGMWLPETAVDLETLDLMAEQGIRFAVLAPHQAARVRRQDERAWQDVSGARVDPTTCYRLALPSGRFISIFFYDGPISREIAFGGLLQRGEDVANRLVGAFNDRRGRPQLVNIATDGETYGHHHRNGDMALAYALYRIEAEQQAKVTNYGEFFETNPPVYEVEIFENTSWSCAHGVERWRSNCGCNTGAHPGWNQEWRAPLRDAFDWLRDTLNPLYQERASQYLKDPWAARDAYIDLLLDRHEENRKGFFAEQAARPLDEGEEQMALKLLELQRHLMLMYTSCGWFFDELSGIETVQVIQYAGRALQLADEVLGVSHQETFLSRLEAAKSNIPEHEDGRVVFQKFVEPAVVDLMDVGAHYAVSSLFEPYEERSRIYCYTVDRLDHRVSGLGDARLALGHVVVASEITTAQSEISFGLLHFGDHNLTCGIKLFDGEEAYNRAVASLESTFASADFPAVIRDLDKEFGELTYSLRSLFKDEQRKVLNRIMESALDDAEALNRQLYDHYAPLIFFLSSLQIPAPAAFKASAEVVINASLRREFEREDLVDRERVRSLLEEARKGGFSVDSAGLGLAYQRRIEAIAEDFRRNYEDRSLLAKLGDAARVAADLPFEVNIWRTQNLYYETLIDVYPVFKEKAELGDAEMQAWVAEFVGVGKALLLEVD